MHCGLSQRWVGALSGLAGRGPGRRGGGALRRRAHTLRLARPCPAVHLPSRSGQARGSGRGGRLWPVSSQWGDSGVQGGGPSGDPLLRDVLISRGVPDSGNSKGDLREGGKPLPFPQHQAPSQLQTPPHTHYEEGALFPAILCCGGIPPRRGEGEDLRSSYATISGGEGRGRDWPHCPFLLPSPAPLLPLLPSFFSLPVCGGIPRPRRQSDGNPLPASLLCFRTEALLSSLSFFPPPPPSPLIGEGPSPRES